MEFKRALITGAAGRLGRAMALELAEQGVDIAIHYNSSKANAEKTQADLNAFGVKTTILQADLNSQSATRTLVQKAADDLGRPLDILINNASAFAYDTVETATEESWDLHMQSNFQASFILTQEFGKQAPTASGEKGDRIAKAAIINIIDQRIRKLTPGFMTYSLSKHGLWAMTRTTAQALAPHIRVNAIGPGPTLKAAEQTEAHYQHQRQNTILERGSDPEDIVDAMLFLLNAKSVTGQLICVDGGQHLGWRTPDVQGLD